jgi:hypothetical protein
LIPGPGRGLSGEQHATLIECPAAIRNDGYLGVRDLTFAGLTPQLEAGFADKPEPVKAPGGQLTRIGVQRELTT